MVSYWNLDFEATNGYNENWRWRDASYDDGLAVEQLPQKQEVHGSIPPLYAWTRCVRCQKLKHSLAIQTRDIF